MAHITHMRKLDMMAGKYEWRDHLEGLNIDGRIILKLIVKV
jgi:hypothetical protein